MKQRAFLLETAATSHTPSPVYRPVDVECFTDGARRYRLLPKASLPEMEACVPKLDFLILGQSKCGTSSLYWTFRDHPEVFVPHEKENAHFFREHFHFGFPNYEYTRQQQYRGEPVIGDCCASNMFADVVPERLHALFGPDLKLFFALRHPVDRALSDYNMTVRNLRETLPFERAIRVEADRARTMPILHFAHGYVGRGQYATQIERYLEYFPIESMRFLVFEEEIRNAYDATVREMCRFIGADPAKHVGNARKRGVAPNDFRISVDTGSVSFLGKQITNPTPELVERIEKVPSLVTKRLEPGYERSLYEVWFADEVERLEKLIGRDLSIWTARYDAPSRPRTAPARHGTPTPGAPPATA